MTKGGLGRSVLFPKCSNNGVFDPLSFLLLNKFNDDKDYALSIASLYVLKNVNGVHEYGVRTAERINGSYLVRNGVNPPKDKKTYYIGFYDALKNDYLSITSQYYKVIIKYKIEHGERAHFQLELHDRGLLGDNKKDKTTRRNDRKTAMQQLLSKLKGPHLYMAAANDIDAPDIESIKLPVHP